MRNIKLVIQYDGGRYKGFNIQKGVELTVASKIQNVLEVMTGEEIELIGCERMDAGVHAENYVANFKTESTLSPETISDYLYEYLPEDIVVKEVEEVEERFHSRYLVKSKTYRYHLNCASKRNVFTRKYVHHLDEKLDIENMEKVAAVFKGTHDFQSFTSMKPGSKSTMKTINDIVVTKEKDDLYIEITADDFLIHMPRLIIGALIEAGKGTVTAKSAQQAMDKKLRAAGNPIAKPKALTLVAVNY